MKGSVWIGVFVGSLIGSWLGAALDHGNWFGLISILLGAVGALAGIWAGYKIGRDYL